MESVPSSEGPSQEELLEDKRVEQILLNLPSNTLDPASRADVALVYLGIKPASYQEVIFSYEGVPRFDSKSAYDKSVKVVDEAIKAVGLPHFTSVRSDVAKFVIGGSLEDAIVLRDACDIPHSPERTRQFGLAIGYPETAVNAYLKDLNEDNKEATLSPADVGRPDLGKVEVFRLSREHWKEELKYMEDADLTLKKYMPDLYKKVTSIKTKS